MVIQFRHERCQLWTIVRRECMATCVKLSGSRTIRFAERNPLSPDLLGRIWFQGIRRGATPREIPTMSSFAIVDGNRIHRSCDRRANAPAVCFDAVPAQRAAMTTALRSYKPAHQERCHHRHLAHTHRCDAQPSGTSSLIFANEHRYDRHRWRSQCSTIRAVPSHLLHGKSAWCFWPAVPCQSMRLRLTGSCIEVGARNLRSR